MRGRGTVKSVSAVVISLALLLGLPGTGYADFHFQGVGVATAGSFEADPGFSDTPHVQSSTLGFYAVGAAYLYLMVSASISWDCKHDEALEADRPLLQRDGFTLASLDPGETNAAGAGNVVGRCTGTTPDYPEFPLEVTCPYLAAAYTRVGTVLQITGVCLYTWAGSVGFGDFTLTTVLTQPKDSASFETSALVFRFRA
jgi:hypothetical protein